VVYRKDTVNNVVRRYASAFALTYEEASQLRMTVEDFFERTNDEVAAAAAAAAEKSEAESSTDESSTESGTNGIDALVAQCWVLWGVTIPELWLGVALALNGASGMDVVASDAATAHTVFGIAAVLSALIVLRPVLGAVAQGGKVEQASAAKGTKAAPNVSAKAKKKAPVAKKKSAKKTRTKSKRRQ